MLHVPDNILQHDNGIVHDEPDRQGQSHHGDIVQGKAEQMHDGKGADDGHGDRA